MKLLIITQKINKNDPILGFFHGWIKEFSKHFDSIVGICLEKGEYDLPSNVRVLSLGKESGQSKVKYLLNFYKYIWRERKNYDAVFVHMNPVYVVLGGLIWKVLHKKIILWYTHKNVDFKLRIAEKFVNKILTASKESFRLPSRKVRIMGHGIDTEKFCILDRSSNDVLTVATIGRISKIKRLDYILKIFASLLEISNADMILEIVGSPSNNEESAYLNEIKHLVESLRLQKSVYFYGCITQEQLPYYINKKDFFINVSETGSLDKAVLETLSCGVATFTSNRAFEVDLKDLGLYTETQDEMDFARFILERHQDISTKSIALRDIIIKKHSLSCLIPRIYTEYETSK